MYVIYISELCSELKINKLFPDIYKAPQLCVQKYHKVMVEGLAEYDELEVEVLTSYPVNHSNCLRRYIKSDREVFNKVVYCYLPTINAFGIKHINTLIQYLFHLVAAKIKKRDRIVLVVDALRIVPSIAALFISKTLKINCVGIVTDLPCFFNKKKFTKAIHMWLLKGYTHYVLLTEAMNCVVNPKLKPYVVIEGQADIHMGDVKNILNEKYSSNVCMYAGTIAREYGLEILTKAFLKTSFPNWELWLVGNGDYVDDYKKLCETNKSLKYMGVWNNSKVVQEQIKASLLVNPRPTNMEYTKYSFPSKNMEYMASGTPVLTTMLPGMPKEYEKYVYLIQEETIEGVYAILKDIFSKSPEELYDKGKKAKEFILREKNNIIQAGKILDMLEGYSWK